MPMVDPAAPTERRAEVQAGDARLAELLHHGQSVWLDQLTRDWLADGTLRDFIAAGVRGVTSNPSIFAAAIAGSDHYTSPARQLAEAGKSAAQIYDALTVADIRAACDLFRELYEDTGGGDGYVSHEVAPGLAHDTFATLREAKRLWAEVGRPNAMIKIPATPEGMPAIERAVAAGINVNVTLMFSLGQYEDVATAYQNGLRARLDAGDDIAGIASVASFFVSRVDTKVDAALRAGLDAVPPDSAPAAEARSLLGRAAVANAARAYQRLLARFSGPEWSALAAHGASPQRVLWASTSTKNAAYSDVKYVAELVANDTVNTLPLGTLEAFRDHGAVERVLDGGTGRDDAVIAALGARGIDLERVGATLLAEGVQAFEASYQEALATVEERRESLAAG